MNSLRKVQILPMRLISPLICSNSIRMRLLSTANESPKEHHEPTASFGFQTVPESEKAEKGK